MIITENEKYLLRFLIFLNCFFQLSAGSLFVNLDNLLMNQVLQLIRKPSE